MPVMTRIKPIPSNAKPQTSLAVAGRSAPAVPTNLRIRCSSAPPLAAKTSCGEALRSSYNVASALA